MKAIPPDYRGALDERIARTIADAQHLRDVLCILKGIGSQGTWLGSRKLGPGTPEYSWCVEAARILAIKGIAAKTGGGTGLMEAPHLGCTMAGRKERSIAVRMANLASEEKINPYAGDGGWEFVMPDFNSRHDALFFGSLFYVVLPGRLGTLHELKDLLNRMKHGLIAKRPVYLAERESFFSDKKRFLTDPVSEDIGPRMSPDDFGVAEIIDLMKVDAPSFVEKLLGDIDWSGCSGQSCSCLAS
jgi:predicted Rossmann-fold nucleotide-binding protein